MHNRSRMGDCENTHAYKQPRRGPIWRIRIIQSSYSLVWMIHIINQFSRGKCSEKWNNANFTRRTNGARDCIFWVALIFQCFQTRLIRLVFENWKMTAFMDLQMIFKEFIDHVANGVGNEYYETFLIFNCIAFCSPLWILKINITRWMYRFSAHTHFL